MSKYKSFRFPRDAYDQWFGKKKKIEERIKLKTRKEVNVPLTDVLRYYGSKQGFEWDDNVIPFFIRRKRTRKFPEGQMI